VVQAYLSATEVAADPLSDRERQVLQLVAEGKTSKEVATILGISVKTAESHRNHIMEKLDIHDVAGLVRYAIRSGLIES
jgi:DNA-binding CsgD family transcriptional regulator